MIQILRLPVERADPWEPFLGHAACTIPLGPLPSFCDCLSIAFLLRLRGLTNGQMRHRRMLLKRVRLRLVLALSV